MEKPLKAIGDEAGMKTLARLEQDVPQWLLQLRQVGMDLIDYALTAVRDHEVVLSVQEKEKPL